MIDSTRSQRPAQRRQTSSRLNDYLLHALESRVFLSAGAVDATFANAGKALFVSGTVSGGADAMAIQSDGKVLLAGSSLPNTNPARQELILDRLTARGTLDPTFGVGGRTAIVVRGTFFAPHAIQIQSDGKIIVAGSIGLQFGAGNFMMIRYNANGAIDRTFGNQGQVTTAFSTGKSQIAAIGLQGNTIVVAGTVFHPQLGVNSQDFALARYSMTGQLDTSFGTGGRVVTDMAGGGDIAESLAIQNDGKIVVGGTAAVIAGPNAGSSIFALARYTANGQLDTSFNKIGKAFVRIAGMDSADDLVLQSSGSIVAGGRAGQQFGMARWLSNGALDTTFGGRGWGLMLAPIGISGAEAGNMTAQADGKLIVSGVLAGSGQLDFAVQRFSKDGVLDTAFGARGTSTIDFGASNDFGTHVAIQPATGTLNGKIVLFGMSISSSSKESFGLARVLTA